MFQNQLNLFHSQRQSLSQIIQNPHKTQEDWKILIIDQSAASILQAHYTVKDLREHLFTMELMIHQKRSPFHGVSAFYLVEPSEANISSIIRDAKDDLYSSVEIHFISDPGNDAIPILASTLAKEAPKFVKTIKKIDYMNINYVPIDTNVAILPTFNELSSLISSLEFPPVFIYDPEQQALVQNTKKKLSSQKHSPDQNVSDNCTAVIVISRQMDYEPVFHFENTFSALAIDNCEIQGKNKLKIDDKSTTLNAKNEFWMTNKFGNVATIITECQSHLNVMSKSKAKSAVEEGKNGEIKVDTGLIKQELSYNTFKNNFDFISAVIQKASSRSIPALLELDPRNLNVKEVDQLFRFPAVNAQVSDKDKLRVVLNYIIQNQKHNKLEELEKLIQKIKKPPIYQQIRNSKVSFKEQGGNLFSQLKSKDMLFGMFKSLITTSKSLMITQIVSGVIKGVNEIKQNSNLKIMDEKNWRRVRKVIVYVAGGINYYEFSEIKACTDAQNIPLVYSGDKIIKASQLLQC